MTHIENSKLKKDGVAAGTRTKSVKKADKKATKKDKKCQKKTYKKVLIFCAKTRFRAKIRTFLSAFFHTFFCPGALLRSARAALGKAMFVS